MALLKCKECGREISDKAINCPNCGCPVISSLDSTEVIKNKKKIFGKILFFR